MYHEIFHNIGIGLLVIMITFMWHALSLDILFRVVHFFLPYTTPSHSMRYLSRIVILFMTTFGIISTHSVEIWMWAFLYLDLKVPSIPDLETSLYFSTVTMTTVGYGDVVLPNAWRLISGMQAASGMILFGWSTAFIFEVLAITYNRFSAKTRIEHPQP